VSSQLQIVKSISGSISDRPIEMVVSEPQARRSQGIDRTCGSVKDEMETFLDFIFDKLSEENSVRSDQDKPI